MDEQKRDDIVNRYKILFHDASPYITEQLIRKLIIELREGNQKNKRRKK